MPENKQVPPTIGGTPRRGGSDLQSNASESLVADGYSSAASRDAPAADEIAHHMANDLVSQEPPPPYGAHHDQVQFSQPGFAADAALNDTGRVSISINTKNRRLADLLAPAIKSQIEGSETGPSLPPAYIPPSLGGQPGQKPPSRLNVVVQIVGSRGDVQPFVALGKVLRDTYGHRVRIATHGTFQSFVEDNGLEFFNIGGDPAELMAFMVKYPGLMPGFEAIKSGEISKRRKGISDILIGCWRSCIESGDGSGPAPRPNADPLDLSSGIPEDDGRDAFVADAIIANPPSFAHIHIAEKLGIPLHMMFTMPWTPTRAFPHPLADIKSSNADDVITNYLSYTLVEMMTWQGLGDVINRFREKVLDLPPLSLIWAPGLLGRLKIPYTYCWSPALIQKPNDWSRNIDVSGFYFLDLATSYTPDPDLAAFLDNGPPPVYIGFGSIVVDDPDAMTQMIFDAVRSCGARALVSKGWGGLGADDIGVPEGVFMLGNVPHDWLFQRVSCVVHHGGAGTTAAGIKAGKPTVVVPFFGDQPFWGAMIARAKAGPDPIPYKKLTAEKLSEAISFCLKPETAREAKLYGEKIREEKGTDVGGQSFHSHLDLDTLRCSVAPSRTAVWRVRRSKVRLSGLAAATLVSHGYLSYADLKLYRPREYNTEDQPPDPISAAACSLVMDASGIGMAIADMPREVFKPWQRDAEDANDRPVSPETSSQGSGAGDVNSSGGGTATGDRLTLVPTSTTYDSSTAGPSSAGGTTWDHPNESRANMPDSASSIASSSAAASMASSADRPKTRPPSGSQTWQTTPLGSGVDSAIGAGRSVGRVVTTGVKSPMNFCLGLAKGFRNIPKLYNDETVRPPEKITGIPSGIKVASKEFGLGLFDGISGLVMQPIKGAEKDGAPGLVKGVGKGIGGLLTKPAAGFWGIPAYTMKGVHVQVSKLFIKSNENYIITSRIIQSQRDLEQSAAEERNDIVARWRGDTLDLKRFDRYKKRDRGSQKSPATSPPPSQDGRRNSRGLSTGSSTETRGGWISRLSNFDDMLRDEKARFHARRDSLMRSSIGSAPGHTPGGSITDAQAAEDAEFERAIQLSVRETSRGNAEEDAAVEAAIRQSVNAVRQRGQLPEPMPILRENDSHKLAEKDPSIFEDDEYRITDEEYQDLIEQAIKDSMTGSPGYLSLPHDSGVAELEVGDTPVGFWSPEEVGRYNRDGGDGADSDSDLARAIEESKKAAEQPSQSSAEDDAELQRAIEASKDEADKEMSQQNEEDIIMKYIMKQSLAEEEFRRQRLKGKGREGEDDDDDNDEDLKRAMGESLRLSRGDDSGPSGAASGGI